MSKTMQRSGFTLSEVIVALVILSMGILAMGASTGYVMSQIQASELRTERMQVVRQTVQLLRSTDWAALPTRCAGGFPELETRRYRVTCDVAQPADHVRRLSIITSGPGFDGSHVVPMVVDTFTISIAKPVS